ncbi:hypothetical protein D3C73_1465270 [compost metagenome]
MSARPAPTLIPVPCQVAAGLGLVRQSRTDIQTMLTSAQAPKPPNSTRERASLLTARWAQAQSRVPSSWGCTSQRRRWLAPCPAHSRISATGMAAITSMGPQAGGK